MILQHDLYFRENGKVSANSINLIDFVKWITLTARTRQNIWKSLLTFNASIPIETSYWQWAFLISLKTLSTECAFHMGYVYVHHIHNCTRSLIATSQTVNVHVDKFDANVKNII